ncbi:MAG: fibronectin type III-like domain-contianing protein [Bacteroides sp.]|nr:fibronectin type III-like domain-contianing protein [Bacteroides sp.]
MEGRTYRYFKGKALFPFGYGLSYTTFSYTDLRVHAESPVTDPLTVKVNITNTGSRDGEEVAQLYVSHPGKDSYLPIRSLKGFQRIFLKAGETKTVTFTLSPKELAVTNDFGELTVLPGPVSISVGGGQPDRNNDIPVVETRVVLTGAKNRLSNGW